MVFSCFLTSWASFLTLPNYPMFVKFLTVLLTFIIYYTFLLLSCLGQYTFNFSQWVGSMLIKQSHCPPMNLAFNLFLFVFNHLFTTFKNLTLDNSLFSYSKPLYKIVFNFFKDSRLWPSYYKMVMFNMWGIRVCIDSSQIFWLIHPPSMSPPTLTLILWGFWPIAYLASNATSLSFFIVCHIALVTLSSFIKSEVFGCVKGPFVFPTNCVGLFSDTCIYGPWYCALPDCAITHGADCI